jgi:riboflavin kinase/FMN adenylyltransferase
LVNQFDIHKIIIGHDHRFGRNRTANIDDLMALENMDLKEQISVQEINDLSVSSTKIRKALLGGDMALANAYLGYDYFLTGTVFLRKTTGTNYWIPYSKHKNKRRLQADST